jgi:hypothetical protein
LLNDLAGLALVDAELVHGEGDQGGAVLVEELGELVAGHAAAPQDDTKARPAAPIWTSVEPFESPWGHQH